MKVNHSTIVVPNADSSTSHTGYAAETPRLDLPFGSESIAALSTEMEMATVVPVRSDRISSDPANSRMRSHISC